MTGVARNTAKLLLAAGVDLGTLGKDEICCGSPVARVGDRETFIALAKRNVEILNKTGARKIVTSCPGCYRALAARLSRGAGRTAALRPIFCTR